MLHLNDVVGLIAASETPIKPNDNAVPMKARTSDMRRAGDDSQRSEAEVLLEVLISCPFLWWLKVRVENCLLLCNLLTAEGETFHGIGGRRSPQRRGDAEFSLHRRCSLTSAQGCALATLGATYGSLNIATLKVFAR